MNLFILSYIIILISSKEPDQRSNAIGKNIKDKKKNYQIIPAEELIVCPEKPSGVVDLSTNPSSIGDYNTIYGCNLTIPKRLYASKSRLILYYCIFKSHGTIDSTEKGGGIYLVLTSNDKIPKEVYQIDHCIFEECKSSTGGAICIKNTQITYNIQITNSIFKHNEASTQG